MGKNHSRNRNEYFTRCKSHKPPPKKSSLPAQKKQKEKKNENIYNK